MHVASRNGHFEVVIMLLKAKAGVNIKTNVSHVDCVTAILSVYVYCISVIELVN